MIKTCKREDCPNTFDTVQTNPRCVYCSSECKHLHRNAVQRAYNKRVQERCKRVGERGKDKQPRKKRERGKHSKRWYELRAVLVKHGLLI